MNGEDQLLLSPAGDALTARAGEQRTRGRGRGPERENTIASSRVTQKPPLRIVIKYVYQPAGGDGGETAPAG
jgi:hypothetical protein